MRTLGKRVYVNSVTRVRIPVSPFDFNNLGYLHWWPFLFLKPKCEIFVKLIFTGAVLNEVPGPA